MMRYSALLEENSGLRLAILVTGLTLSGLAAGALVALATPAYVAAGIVGLVAGLVLLSSTYFSLLAVLAVATLLPFAAIPLPIGFVPTFLDVVLLCFFVGWLARLVTRPEERLVATPATTPLLIFMGLAVVSFILSQGISQSTARYFVELLLSLALFFGDRQHGSRPGAASRPGLGHHRRGHAGRGHRDRPLLPAARYHGLSAVCPPRLQLSGGHRRPALYQR